jgi:hypothetical protein
MISKIMTLSAISAVIFSILIIQSCHKPENEIKQAVRDQLQRYPESTLQDIYKSFFQDEFGPGHLLNDTAGAREYLEYELSEMTSSGNYFAEPCGRGRNFYRVPLDLVKDGKVPFDSFFAAFMESAASFRVPETEEWKVKWQQIVKVIESMDLGIKNFDQDKSALSRMLDSGENVVHHSEGYEELYKPHYRIMGKEQWEKLNGKLH